MGLLKTALNATGGMCGDQWEDSFTVPEGLGPTVALFAPVPRYSSVGLIGNTRGAVRFIADGSRIVVPEGYGFVLIGEGRITGFVAEPGGYLWYSDPPDSQSIFAGDGIMGPLTTTSGELFNVGGSSQAQQQAFFVSMKELPNNWFATASAVYWDDAQLKARVGAFVRGTYTLRIADPILFVLNCVSATYLQTGAVFDFTDPSIDVARQISHEFVGSLSQALSRYTHDPSRGNRMTHIQQDPVGFGRSLSEVVERAYKWRSGRGIEIVSAAIVGLDYDEPTRELLKTARQGRPLRQ